MKFRERLSNFGKIFHNVNYIMFALLIGLIFFSLNVLISSFISLYDFYTDFGLLGSIKFFFNLLFGYNNTISQYSFFSLIIISLLIGLFFSMILYKYKINNSVKVGTLSGLAIFFAMLVPGCAACGIGLVSALGLSAAVLSLLPFKGLEISLISIFLLILAIFNLSGNLSSCNISLRKKMKGGNRNGRKIK